MNLLVVGTLAFDSVESPFGKRERALGGSANYLALAANNFCNVRIVGAVGEDFPEQHLDTYRSRGIDTAGVERLPGKTFFWAGRYEADINTRATLATELNVIDGWCPHVPEAFRDSEYVALGNIDPVMQVKVLDQLTKPKFVAADTMNYWIERTPDALRALLRRVDLLSINDSEARLLSGKYNLVYAAAEIRKLGPKILIIKRGEHGATVFFEDDIFIAPAFPILTIKDPTGAGDTFAGGLLGYLAQQDRIDKRTVRQATIIGCTLASFTVEDFSSDRLLRLQAHEIKERCHAFRRLIEFDPPADDAWPKA